MYASSKPFTRESNRGPQPVKKAKKAKVEESIIPEPAKIEVIDTITEPAPEEAEPVLEELDGNS